MEIMPLLIPFDEQETGRILGYQVLVEQDLPPEIRTMPRILRDSVHEIIKLT